MKKVILLIAAFIGINSAQAQEITPSVSVKGEGIVKIVPNQVLIRVRVENKGTSALQVKKENDIAVDKVLKYVKKMGVEEKDIKTEYININKNYDYQAKEYEFLANQSISILLKDLSKYSDFTEGLFNAGINRMDGVTFQSPDIEKYNSEARILAMKNAKKKAEEYAAVLEQKVGRALSISESITASVPQPIYRMDMMKSAAVSAESMETIAIGEMAVEAEVNVVFLLQ